MITIFRAYLVFHYSKSKTTCTGLDHKECSYPNVLKGTTNSYYSTKTKVVKLFDNCNTVLDKPTFYKAVKERGKLSHPYTLKKNSIRDTYENFLHLKIFRGCFFIWCWNLQFTNVNLYTMENSIWTWNFD